MISFQNVFGCTMIAPIFTADFKKLPESSGRYGHPLCHIFDPSSSMHLSDQCLHHGRATMVVGETKQSRLETPRPCHRTGVPGDATRDRHSFAAGRPKFARLFYRLTVYIHVPRISLDYAQHVGNASRPTSYPRGRAHLRTCATH